MPDTPPSSESGNPPGPTMRSMPALFSWRFPPLLPAKLWLRWGPPNLVAIDLVGRFSLFAFFAGILTLTLAMWLIHRRAVAETLSSTPNAFESTTVVLDENEVSIIGSCRKPGGPGLRSPA